MTVMVAVGDSLQQTIVRSRARYRGPLLIYDLGRIGAVARALALIGRRTGIDFIGAAKALPFDGLLRRGRSRIRRLRCLERRGTRAAGRMATAAGEPIAFATSR